jgi:hypothetical protein
MHEDTIRKQFLSNSLLRNVQTGSEAHPASYKVGAGGYFPGDKATGK